MLTFAKEIHPAQKAKNLLYAAIILAFLSCNGAVQTEHRSDSAYKAITDTSKIIKDTLVVPDSTARGLTH